MGADNRSLTEILADAYAEWADARERDIGKLAGHSEKAILQLTMGVAITTARSVVHDEQVASFARRLGNRLADAIHSVDWDDLAGISWMGEDTNPAPPPK